ncbi:copper homeostasis protein CutC [Pedobacter changchengzhani]|uniref:PF03932 family protein CutC n=2 Tax=Pedobacter changchengzhani TaxID=2529274 RepID=A0A4R5MIL6_9SPHI|nr:copper homeostasis protein CutC [Pedobacter changchengzhani]
MGLEICANSYSSAIAAQNGGAIRVELCENMADGGTTPSYAQIKRAVENLKIEVWPIIRPRGGDFLYNNDEFEIMKEDIKICKILKCGGIVFGILTSDGEIDKERCAELIELAKPMPVAFHRAFDMSNDLPKALETLIELGFVRVLSSGGAENAHKGIKVLNRLVNQADGRIQIMPGAGINPQNILEIATKTGAFVFHSSARVKVLSKMKFKNSTTKMATSNNEIENANDEYQYEQTSEDLVKKMAQQISLKN